MGIDEIDRLRDALLDMQTECASLVAENETLREDAARLDYLQSISFDSTHDGKHAVILIAPYDGDRPPTVREAIDKAMRLDVDGGE